MNILLSLNYKFFNTKPEELLKYINNIDNDKIIKGFEVNAETSKEREYLYDLAKECNKYNYMLNIHLPCLNSIEEYKEYLDYLNEITKVYKNEMNMVFHPIYNKEKKQSIEVTSNYINDLLKYIEVNNYNLRLSIENLNDIGEIKRLKKEDIKEILIKYDKLNFTYDIGHEYIDGRGTIKKQIDSYLISKMNNIHIHTFNKTEDHYPIEDISKDKIVIEMLNNISQKGYKGQVVLEYALDYIEGENLNKKLEKYIKEAKNISYYIN